MLTVSKDFLDEKSKIIINFLEGKLKYQQIRYFIEYHMVGEEGLGYEILCEQIYELGIKIPKRIFELLKEMCLLYNIKECYWKNLELLIID